MGSAQDQDSTVPLPTVGRIVHYVGIEGEKLAAIVTRTRVGSSVVDLQVFHYNRGVELATSVAQGDGTAYNTWSWPARD